MANLQDPLQNVGMDNPQALQVFTATSAYSLLAVAAVGLVAATASKILLRRASWQDKFTFIWLVRIKAFDGMTHLVLEGSFVYLSTFGRTVDASEGMFSELWKEYARADARWGIADPNVVSLEILTVLGGAPLCFYILKQLVENDPARHYWIIVLCTAELYGGWMTWCPEWLIGSPSLDISNPLYLWVYLVMLTPGIVLCRWVLIPLWLMVDSYGHIAGSLRRMKDPKVKED
ncbi:hypothetical protein ID866_8393 [Astraeus odoratus]|nr:hypothetical protein ID866_8393 [Astraeus odoratus]